MKYTSKLILNGTEYEFAEGSSGVQTFDFQTDGALSWTGQEIYGTPSLTTGQGRTIGTNSSGTYQSMIMPPASVYNGEKLLKRKLWMYKTGINTFNASGCGFGTSNFTNGVGIWQQSDASRYMANIYDGSTDHPTETISGTGEVTVEYEFNDDGHIYLSINGGTQYDLGSYASQFRTRWLNNDLGISIGRWSVDAPYIRKLEITTQP